MAIENLYRRIEAIIADEIVFPGSNWEDNGCFAPDLQSLNSLISIPLSAGSGIRSGDMPACLDLWVAKQFGAAGFDRDLLWPRDKLPRVVDPNVQKGISVLPDEERSIRDRILKASGASKDAYVMGAAYAKQVDVGMASWPSGPELLISTKTMSGSFSNNIKNRFEEAYGDVMNLRARHPLAAHGYCFMLCDDVLGSPGQFSRAIHTLRQLRQTAGGYDAVCLILYRQEALDGIYVSTELQRSVPGDLTCSAFFNRLIEIILAASPAEKHVAVRENKVLTC